MQPRPLLYTAHETDCNFVPFIQLTLKLLQRVIDLTLAVKAHLILITMLRLSGVFPSASDFKKIKEGEFLGMVMLCKLASTMRTKELCVGAFFKTKHALDLSYTTLDTR